MILSIRAKERRLSHPTLLCAGHRRESLGAASDAFSRASAPSDSPPTCKSNGRAYANAYAGALVVARDLGVDSH